VDRQTGSHVQAIQLVVVGFAQIAVTGFENDVARSTGTASTAGVLDVDSEIDGHVENRLRLAVLVVRHFAVLEFDGLVGIDKRDFWHSIHSIAPCFAGSPFPQRTGGFVGETAKLPY